MATFKSSDLNLKNAEITECPICTDKISNKYTRQLPCGHTFCIKCLEQYKQTMKSRRKSLLCPVCRKEFTITDGSCFMLIKNSTADKILEAESMPNTDDRGIKQCDLCEKDNKSVVAIVHCTDCDQSFCGSCKKLHIKLKPYSTHHVNSVSKTSQFRDTARKRFCDNHPEYMLEFMCYDCNKPICRKCRSLTHDAHIFAVAEEIASSYCEQLQGNIEAISHRLSNMAKFSEDIQDQEKQMQVLVSKEKETVSKVAADLIRSVKANAKIMIKQLSSTLHRNFNALKQYKIQVESHTDILRQNMTSITQLKESGEIWEIIKHTEKFIGTTCKLLCSNLITTNNFVLSYSSESEIKNQLNGTNIIFKDHNSRHAQSKPEDCFELYTHYQGMVKDETRFQSYEQLRRTQSKTEDFSERDEDYQGIVKGETRFQSVEQLRPDHSKTEDCSERNEDYQGIVKGETRFHSVEQMRPDHSKTEDCSERDEDYQDIVKGETRFHSFEQLRPAQSKTEDCSERNEDYQGIVKGETKFHWFEQLRSDHSKTEDCSEREEDCKGIIGGEFQSANGLYSDYVGCCNKIFGHRNSAKQQQRHHRATLYKH